MRPLAVIVARARDGAIGKGGQLPWRYPEDLKHFKALTMGHAIIMGRKTYESIGKPLPGRRSIVISRMGTRRDGCETARSLPEALALVADDPLPFAIGGGELYREALGVATRLYVTEVDVDVVDGDTHFPALASGAWREVSRLKGATPELTFVELERIE